MASLNFDFIAAGFDWDDGNREKCRKHGVSIAEIEQLFRKSISILADLAHSSAEERYKAIGINDEGRYIFVVFTLRTRGEEARIRPVSARFMHKKEVRHYERQKTEAEKTSRSENG